MTQGFGLTNTQPLQETRSREAGMALQAQEGGTLAAAPHLFEAEKSQTRAQAEG